MTKFRYLSQSKIILKSLDNSFVSIALSVVFSFLLSLPIYAQQANDSKWFYMGTDAEVNRYYLQEKTKKTDDGFIQGWMKTIAEDGINAKRLYQWDCTTKRMRMLSIAVYYANNKLAYSDEKVKKWKLIVPDTVGDRMLDKVCGKKREIYIAEITSIKANMRKYPGTKNKILKIANKGEKFRVISSLNNKSWYNVVDETNQEDYWIHRSTVKVFKEK